MSEQDVAGIVLIAAPVWFNVGFARLEDRPLRRDGAPLTVEAAGTAPASAEHRLDACYERSLRSLISATGSVGPRDTSPAPYPRSCPVTAEGPAVAVSPLSEAAVPDRGRVRGDCLAYLSGESVNSMRVRTYWFPGLFNEANPDPRLATPERAAPRRSWFAPVATPERVAVEGLRDFP